MMREEELNRILNNLTLKGNPESKDALFDLKIMEQTKKLSQFIDEMEKKDNLNIEKTVDLEKDFIDGEEVERFEQILRDELDTIIHIQQVVLEDDDGINQNICSQQMKLNYGYFVNNIDDVKNGFVKLFELFLKFRDWVLHIGGKGLYNQVAIKGGDFGELNLKGLNELYRQILMQLNYLIRCYNLDKVRKELVNIVKQIIIKTETGDR